MILIRVDYRVLPNYWNLCLTECLDGNSLLNKRSELVRKCMHQNKLLLCNVKRNKRPYGLMLVAVFCIYI